MIRMTVAHLGVDRATNSPVVILREVGGERVLPIWIGSAEAHAIAVELQGARPQRPLWASTSTKDPGYSDIHYVEPLVARQTVNTLPPETMDAYRAHGRPEVRIHETIAQAPARLDELKQRGIDLERITYELEVEGVEKFGASYRGVLEAIAKKRAVLSTK